MAISPRHAIAIEYPTWIIDHFEANKFRRSNSDELTVPQIKENLKECESQREQFEELINKSTELLVCISDAKKFQFNDERSISETHENRCNPQLISECRKRGGEIYKFFRKVEGTVKKYAALCALNKKNYLKRENNGILKSTNDGK